MVVRGRILAPRTGVLRGTVGSRVLELAAGEFAIDHCDIALEDALAAEEAFITSSVRGVVPVVRIDDHAIGDGRVGPVVTRLMEMFGTACF